MEVKTVNTLPDGATKIEVVYNALHITSGLATLRMDEFTPLELTDKELDILSKLWSDSLEAKNTKDLQCKFFSDTMPEKFLSFSDPSKEVKLENGRMSKENFCEQFRKRACSEWTKITPSGEYFKGHWKDKTCKDPGELTLQDNESALFEMPFSHPVILMLLIIVCQCSIHESAVMIKQFCMEIDTHMKVYQK